ncbi:Zn-ribbon domain-containing OB-fold protein [Chloroflexota bacterium]
MVSMQSYVAKWYDFLDKGKIMGLKCNRCDSYEFPPVSVCDKCSATDLGWVEMSGQAQLVTFTLCLFPDPPFATFAPFTYGAVTMKEGPHFHAMILGLESESPVELYRKLPLQVQAEIQDRGDHKFVAFRAKT